MVSRDLLKKATLVAAGFVAGLVLGLIKPPDEDD
jgi:hypothetical protein